VLLGLLAFNWPGTSPERKTFMGDGGSQFVGFVIAMLVLRLDESATYAFPSIAALIVLSPFIYDVCFTLLRRLSRGENIFVAHRSHLYQRLLIAGWSHGKTLLLNSILWITCVYLAYLYARAGWLGQLQLRYFVFLATAVVLFIYTAIVLLVERNSKINSAH
jgi:UDP-N-acetylmuramyl pentapeptide phosphotransferase/UDP-N-acetylglucosamine-1-phosphate transferase